MLYMINIDLQSRESMKDHVSKDGFRIY